MIIFTVMIYIIVFALCAGAVISVLIFVPTVIYNTPYWFWLSGQNSRGKLKDLKNESLFKSFRNATRLYKAWITGQKPTF